MDEDLKGSGLGTSLRAKGEEARREDGAGGARRRARRRGSLHRELFFLQLADDAESFAALVTAPSGYGAMSVVANVRVT